MIRSIVQNKHKIRCGSVEFYNRMIYNTRCRTAEKKSGVGCDRKTEICEGNVEQRVVGVKSIKGLLGDVDVAAFQHEKIERVPDTV